MKKRQSFGFTLVELLIVIALIGVLAVALMATLNPIEQVNKARDSKFKNDAAEVLAAIERYYATQNYYPWSPQVWGGEGTGIADETEVALHSRMPGFGVCYGAAYDTDLGAGSCISATVEAERGDLIKTDELKSSFANKEPFGALTVATNYINMFYLYKAADDSSIYVCYIPKAKSNRKYSATESQNMKNLTIVNDLPTTIAGVGDQATVDAALWTTAADSYFKCVPE